MHLHRGPILPCRRVTCGLGPWQILSLKFFPMSLLHGPLPSHPWIPCTSNFMTTQVHLHTQKRKDRKTTHPLRTTMKSMTFQPLRRYEPLWKMNPRATILIPASKQKIPMKYGSVFSCGMRSKGAGKEGDRLNQMQTKAHPDCPLHSDHSCLLRDSWTSALGQPHVQVGRACTHWRTQRVHRSKGSLRKASYRNRWIQE